MDPIASSVDSTGDQPLDPNQPPAGNLGPFSPPADYQFEEELEGNPPRPIPMLLRQGRHARKQRLTMWALFFAGIFCLACAPLPLVKTWALYFLPLDYLAWIGLGFVVLAGIGALSYFSVRGPYRYVRDGQPLVVRICELFLHPSLYVNGQPSSWRFTAIVECRDPLTGELRLEKTQSNDLGLRKERYTTSFRVGDYVTAVCLPNDPWKTLRLYGFLDLRPDVGVVEREPASPFGVFKLFCALLLLFGVLALLGSILYGFERYAPLEMTFSQHALPFALGASLIGGSTLVALFWGYRRSIRQRALRNQEALASGQAVELDPRVVGQAGGLRPFFLGLVCLVGCPLMGGMISLAFAFALNGALDDSPAQSRLVLIRERVMVTHNFILREYKVKYEFPGKATEKHEYLSTPTEIMQLDNGPALVEVHAGRFGWAWVKAITPLQPAGPANLPVQGIRRPEMDDFFVKWFKAHGHKDVIVDADGVGIQGNRTRLRAALYQSKQHDNGGFVVEVEFTLRLPSGQEMKEFVAGIGKTEDQAIKDTQLNFMLTTFHVVYKAFINPADPHLELVSVTNNGGRRELIAGDLYGRGEASNKKLDLHAMRGHIQEALLKFPLAPGPHWIKIVYSQVHEKPMTVAVTLDNVDRADLTDAVAHLAWPRRDQFYMVKQFLVIK